MSKLISSDYKQSIFSLMRFLLTNELATKMTLFGKTSKLAFASLNLYSILESWFTHFLHIIKAYIKYFCNLTCFLSHNILFLEVVLKSSPEVTIKKLQEPVQSWLRHANERFSKQNLHVVENVS